ncbi:tetratricopeptide repeat protein [Psychrobacter sp. P11G5]|uniref:tetratricopeptide repeat protein n=1 Tax=Psychrobacter sp. P11G5 TaxID=1699624 RepID=UPI00078BA87C|nr:tetratricopeptide repeat protein [Psychrobacter sp. P11G5]AMN67803.1 hypothetical protein AK825_08890 [Psychrobacter sp. P11G5]
MLAKSNSASANVNKTSLDYMAEGYWQDFIAGRPVAGGIAYEVQLHQCQLDESLVSLQRVDTLISQIRRDIAKSTDKSRALDEITLLTDDSYRNLLLFLAFYTGRVLARQWQNIPHWYGQFELRKHYPELPVVADDFYQHMAVVYSDNSNDSADVFFALEPIGMRLFGHIDRQFQAVQGEKIASGLYQAVSARLPKNNGIDESVAAEPNLEHHSESVGIRPILITDETFQNQRLPVQATEHREIPVTKLVVAQQAKSSIVDAAASVKPKISETPINLSATTTQLQTVKHSKAFVTPEIFTQLLIELKKIEVAQDAGNDDYLQACKILDQFERHIARQNKPRDQMQFSELHQTSRQQALTLLQNASALGNTDAMLRLAMYELLGEGLITDTEASKVAGVDWVKQAANDKDVRAQRLLSKMYYQGVGVSQDINSGKYWLEEAAKNGHVEAAELVTQWQDAQALITTQKQEQHSIKRYQLLIGIVLVGAILLVVFV